MNAKFEMVHSLLALYIHIPFCRRICPFCAFAVRKDQAALRKAYLHFLNLEMERRASQFEKELGALQSIYFGGGTPSSLSLEEVEIVLKGVRRHFHCSADTEISFEVNPEDATPAYIQGLTELGIGRISLGIQSFQKASLETLERNHSAQDSLRAVAALEESGVRNFNLDLMFGIPEQSMPEFENDLMTFLEHHPSHLSLYALDVEPRTPFAREKKVVEWVAQHEDLTWAMYLKAVKTLGAHGLAQYEVSNFARPGHESRSNLMVWSGKAYLGLGMGAHSYFERRRWSNHRSLKKYQRALEDRQWPVAFEEELSRVQRANEGLMLALRQVAGLSVPEWEKTFGMAWPRKNVEEVEKLHEQGFARWDLPHLALLPEGMLLADEITARLMLD